MLRPDLFEQMTKIWGKPSIDLFASRLNAQVPCYVSWKPDPEATYVGACSISWENHFFYAFPPFSLIPRCLQKIEMEKAEGIMIVPLWPTQPWYSQLLHLIIEAPKTLPAGNCFYLKAVFTPLKIGQMEISCLHFKQYKNHPFITQINDLGCFMNFWVIFRYIWKEIIFLAVLKLEFVVK